MIININITFNVKGNCNVRTEVQTLETKEADETQDPLRELAGGIGYRAGTGDEDYGEEGKRSAIGF